MRNRRDAAAVALLVAGTAIFWGRFFGGGLVFYARDFGFFFAPLRAAFAQAIRSGSSPFWNPSIGGGVPMAADPNNAVFFPPTLLFLLRPFSSAARWSYGLWLIAFPLAAYAGLRRLRISPVPAAITSFALSISGPAMTLTSFPHVAWASMLFLPIVALARGAARGRRRDAVLAGIVFGMAIDIGEPVIAFHLLVAAAVFSYRRPIGRWASRVATFVGLGASVALPQIVSAAGLLPDTFRGSGLDPRFASAFNSVRPLRVFAFLWPGLFGDVQSPSPAGYWGTQFFDAGVPYVTSLALGTVALALLPVAWRDREGRRFVLLAAFALLASFGRHLPGGMTLLSLPGLSMFRYPEKWLFLAAYAIVAAAAFALERLRSAEGREDRLVAAAALVAALSLGVFVYCYIAPKAAADALYRLRVVADHRFGDAAVRAIGRDALQAALFAALAVIAASRRRPGRKIVALLGVVWLVDLFPRTWNWVSLAPSSTFDAPPAEVEKMRAAAGRFFFDRETEIADDPLRPMRPAMWGVEYAGNNDIDRFSPRRSFLYGRALASIDFADPRKVALLRLADVRAVSSIDPAAATVLAPRFSTSPARTVFLLSGGSRFRLFPAASTAVGEEGARAFVLDRRRDPLTELVVEGPSAAHFGGLLAADSVRPLRRRPDREEVEIDAGAGGWLFRSETFDRHWRATIDGRPVPVFAADYAFQAVAVPAGSHRVAFVYSDAATLAAMALSLGALLAAALALGRPTRDSGLATPATGDRFPRSPSARHSSSR